MKHYPVKVKKILNIGTSEERLSNRSVRKYIHIDDKSDPTSVLGMRTFFGKNYCEVVAVDADYYTRDVFSTEPIVYATEKRKHPIWGEEKLLEFAAKEVEGAVKSPFSSYYENCGYEKIYCDTPNGALSLNCVDRTDFHIYVYERVVSDSGKSFLHMIRNEDFCLETEETSSEKIPE